MCGRGVASEIEGHGVQVDHLRSEPRAQRPARTLARTEACAPTRAGTRTRVRAPAPASGGISQAAGRAGRRTRGGKGALTPAGVVDTKAAGAKPKNSSAESAAVQERGPLRKQAPTMREVSSAMRPGLLIWYFSCVPSTSFQLRNMASRSRSGPTPAATMASAHEMSCRRTREGRVKRLWMRRSHGADEDEGDCSRFQRGRLTLNPASIRETVVK